MLVDVEGNVERLFGLVDAADLDRRLARLAGEPATGEVERLEPGSVGHG